MFFGGECNYLLIGIGVCDEKCFGREVKEFNQVNSR
jgi:hypothetical protein